MLEDMTVQRMDHVGVVVDDLEAATAFFLELGLELEGEATVEGRWVDRVVGLDDVRVDVAMVRTPDGHGRLELTKFHTPTAASAEPNAPANTLGIRRIMFRCRRHRGRPCPPARPWRRTGWRAGAVRGQLSALLRPRPRGHHRCAGRAAQLKRSKHVTTRRQPRTSAPSHQLAPDACSDPSAPCAYWHLKLHALNGGRDKLSERELTFVGVDTWL